MAEFKLEEKVAVAVALVVVIGVFVLAGSFFDFEKVISKDNGSQAGSSASPEDIQNAFDDASGSFNY